MDLIINKILENKELALSGIVSFAGVLFLNLIWVLVKKVFKRRSDSRADARQKLSGSENIQIAANTTGDITIHHGKDDKGSAKKPFKFRLVVLFGLLSIEVIAVTFVINQLIPFPFMTADEESIGYTSEPANTDDEETEKEFPEAGLSQRNGDEDGSESAYNPRLAEGMVIGGEEKPSRPASQIRTLTGDSVAGKFVNNVVQISVTFTNGDMTDGFGFVVGKRSNNLYAVTAGHVVRSDDPDVTTKEVRVRFHQNKGESHIAKLLDLSYSGFDLALIEMPKPSEDYKWESKYFSRPKRNDKVWFIGRNREWYVSTDTATGHVSWEPVSGEFYVDMYSVQPGTSGSPLITKDGIVGMIIEDSSIEVTALDIGMIRMVVTQKWGYPWDLQQIKTDRNAESDGKVKDETAPAYVDVDKKTGVRKTFNPKPGLLM